LALIVWLLAQRAGAPPLDPTAPALLALLGAWGFEGRLSRAATSALALLAEALFLGLPPRAQSGAAALRHALVFTLAAVALAWMARRLAQARELRGKAVPEDVQARLDTIFEASGEAIALLAADGNVRHASRSTPRILGLPLAELVGSSLRARAHPDDADGFDAVFDRCLAHPGQPFALNVRLADRDGAWRHFAGVLTNELSDPNVQALIFNYRDVGARLEMERALRASEERYRTLVEKSVAGFYLTDLDGRFVACNPALARLLGRAAPAELVGVLDADLYVDPEVRRRGGAKLRREGGLSGFEIDLRRADGETRRFVGSANIVRGPEGEELIEGTLLDVTEHARAEERARLLDRMKRNFMVVASHEMRTPLTVVRGYLELMLDTERARAGAHVPFLEVSLTNLDRLVTIVANITEVLAIEENRLSISPAEIDLAELLRSVASELASFAAARGQTLDVTAPERAPWQADPDKLRAALQQLVENAIKFTPDGGRIEVRLAVSAQGVEFVVEDSGMGIEAWELEHIFEKFYAGAEPLHHGSGRFRFGTRGPGLGLAIAKGYAEAHGGTLRAHSDGRGRGSTFHLELPAPAAA
jgi:PAS domain S-box-containing protein